MRATFFIVAIFLLSSCIYTTKAQSVECAVCTTVVGTIESWVDSNATESEIETYLQGLCNNIPQYSAVCDVIVDYGLGYVISYLQNDGTPQALCTLLTFCSSTDVKEIEQVEDGMTCYICEQVVTTIESWLASQASEQEIEGYFNQWCDVVPAYALQCQAIVDAGWPTIIGWIEDSANSTQVCEKLSLCAAAAAAAKPKPVAPKVEGTALECEACKVVVNTVENWLARNDTESTIETEIEKIFCSVGGAFTATCDAIVQDGIPYFINWVDQNEGADVLCAQMSICTQSIEVIHKSKTFSHVKIN